MRKTLRTLGYMTIIEMIAVYLVAFPVYAFQVSSSSTGYVRVATQSAQLAYIASNRAAMLSTVAAAASVVSPASVAVRLATGPVGWAALGVSVALTLAQMYYSQADIAAVRQAASPVATGSKTYTFNGQTYTASGYTEQSANPACSAGGGFMYFFPAFSSVGSPPPSPGMSTTGITGWWCFPSAPQPVTTAPTAQQVTDYLNGLPSGNAQSPESHTAPVGQGAAATSADNVSTVQVSPTQIAPTVKRATDVLPTDSVLDPNAPQPAGPQPVTTPSTSTSTTTTTTTNPDGSTTTETQEEPTALSCSAGNHDQRTFGSILQSHINVWQGSGLLSALNLLKTLTWPEAIPTYSLSSTIMGSFTLDFSVWSGMLTALRALIIAVAGFVAYRIIFVGSK